MDSSQRWETEALRSGSLSRKSAPQPSSKKHSPETVPPDKNTNWVTLKDAEAATGIPLNTLRKWSRKSAIPSYLESDGDLTLRMVDLDAVVGHAHDLGREVTPAPEEDTSDVPSAEADEIDDREDDEAVEVEPIVDEEPEIEMADDTDAEGGDEGEPATSQPSEAPAPPEGTLIVPLDAWNKMLNQLGNLHEAGQQLAEARERAAKAETEATFLRERLAEIRSQTAEAGGQTTEAGGQTTEARSKTPDSSGVPLSMGTSEEPSGAPGVSSPDNTPDEVTTTSYWRYLTFGWRDRKKRQAKQDEI